MAQLREIYAVLLKIDVSYNDIGSISTASISRGPGVMPHWLANTIGSKLRKKVNGLVIAKTSLKIKMTIS